MITTARLAQFIGTTDTDPELPDAVDTAIELVTDYVGDEYVPVNILERAQLLTGSELYHQKNSPQGISNFATLEGVGIRVARDPMTAAYPLLSKYVFGVA